MDLFRRSVALYGRFLPGQRDRLQHDITERGGTVARDLTQKSDFLVVGALATALIDSGVLDMRLQMAASRGVPVFGERAFARAIAGNEADAPTLALDKAAGVSTVSIEDARLLAAFGLITLQDSLVRFGDAGMLRTAANLLEQKRSRSDVIRILQRARDIAPTGRHKIVLTSAGTAALQWDKGLTTLEGQGFLPLEDVHDTLDDVFEQAEVAEAGGDYDTAARLYETYAQADRDDAIAPYNLGNIRLAQEEFDAAVLAFQRAVARDPEFIEARYNLSLAYEKSGTPAKAAEELRRVLLRNPLHADATFNLAQLELKAGEIAEAKLLYERYLQLSPPDDWAATARKAITYCAARLAG